ncbi:hypothetical protein K488DRAFT_28099, partial [Vararia minispora EC-137]
ITLEDTMQSEFEALLSIFYPEDLDHGDLSTQEEWEAVLKLSSRWSFTSLRARALRKLDTLISSFDRLMLARAYNIDQWVEEALRDLCTRSKPLTVGEIRQISIEDIAFVTEARE